MGRSALATTRVYLVFAVCQSCVKLTDNKQNSGRNVYGRIIEIVAPSTSGNGAVAVLDIFGLKASRHPVFGMPVLSRSTDGNSYLIVHIEVSQTCAPIGLVYNQQTAHQIPVQCSTRLHHGQMHCQQTCTTTAQLRGGTTPPRASCGDRDTLRVGVHKQRPRPFPTWRRRDPSVGTALESGIPDVRSMCFHPLSHDSQVGFHSCEHQGGCWTTPIPGEGMRVRAYRR